MTTVNRRQFIHWLGAGGLAASGLHGCYYPSEGLWNECPVGGTPQALLDHELVQAAWEGIDKDKMWDCHVHLLGQGDGATGAWVNPEMKSLWHPIQNLQFRFYLNAVCMDSDTENLDLEYITRLLRLTNELGKGPKLMLLAFDFSYAPNGQRLTSDSAFYVPNKYAAAIVSQHPHHCEWIASVHPYRSDAIERLDWAVRHGTKAIKWLPSAMGMDPASSQCNPFYDAMARHNVPLLCHAGTEYAVHGVGNQDLGNPLRLRLPLDRGVRVIVAHCGALGSSVDIDRGENAAEVENFQLFTRLMEDKNYEELVVGDLSGMTQVNRLGRPLEVVIEREDWRLRILNGSDYPLPGVKPLFSMDDMIRKGYLKSAQAEVLTRIRKTNPLLFDFVCKRSIRHANKALAPDVFETRRHFV